MNKTTGNVCIDMIYAALQHYKKFGRKIKTVSLNKSHWRLFSEYMKREQNLIEVRDDGVQFKNVLIRKGTRFQTKIAEFELESVIKN